MILITGGMGFIGLHTARALLDRGEEAVLTQFSARREPSFLKDEMGRRVNVASLNVVDGAAVREAVLNCRATGIVHLAFPGLESRSPGDDYRVAMLGWLNVLEAATAAGVRRVTLASSNAVYGGVPAGPFEEEMTLPVGSRNVIEAFKKAKETTGLHYADRTGLDVVCMRISAVFGPAYHSMRNLPSRLTHAAVRGTRPDLGSVFGAAPLADDASDLCYVKDCAAAIALLQTAETLPGRIYNVGSGQATSNAELAAAVNAAVPGARLGLPPGRNAQAKANNYMDLSRIRHDVGYEPRYDIERGIAEYAEWLRHNSE